MPAKLRLLALAAIPLPEAANTLAPSPDGKIGDFDDAAGQTAKDGRVPIYLSARGRARLAALDPWRGAIREIVRSLTMSRRRLKPLRELFIVHIIKL